jgi:hypothetical protein
MSSFSSSTESDSKKPKTDHLIPMRPSEDANLRHVPSQRVLSTKVEEISAPHINSHRATEEDIKRIDPNYLPGTPSAVRGEKTPL